MKFRVTTVQIFDVDEDDERNVNIHQDAFHDSLMDNLLDFQDSEVETSDTKFVYVPGVIEKLEVVALDEDAK